jgi:hypothetical protein
VVSMRAGLVKDKASKYVPIWLYRTGWYRQLVRCQIGMKTYLKSVAMTFADGYVSAVGGN